MGDLAIFSMYGLDFLSRWIHLLGGITWIGLLYYFNFVQTEYFKEADPAHRAGAIQSLFLWLIQQHQAHEYHELSAPCDR